MKIGVTGHRMIPAGDLPEIEQAVQTFLAEQEERARGERPTLLSSLAEGADMLCARLALARGWRLVAPLPLPPSDYRQDFPDAIAKTFDALLTAADEAFVILPSEPIPASPSRGFYYRQAGLYVAQQSDLLLALWDQIEKTTPDGAGTYETIRSAQQYNTPLHFVKVNC